MSFIKPEAATGLTAWKTHTPPPVSGPHASEEETLHMMSQMATSGQSQPSATSFDLVGMRFDNPADALHSMHAIVAFLDAVFMPSGNNELTLDTQALSGLSMILHNIRTVLEEVAPTVSCRPLAARREPGLGEAYPRLEGLDEAAEPSPVAARA